ncbi:hypothetical protein MMC14_003462 [Varicellaria rhodocarpa]|nr:hypothetical protein [Varicellaria rhodocarpa]
MASPLPPDPYKVLNVPKNALLATIRSAHRKLVLTCHPDKFPDDSVKAKKADEFHQVQQAYEILSDETRRQRYDERVKLAELRAELMADKGGPRRMAQEYSPRSAGNSTFEMRGGTRYEEIHPRTPYEDDQMHARWEAQTRRHEERPEPPRRSSVRVEEERRRTRNREAEESERDRIRLAKERIKADDRSQFRDQRKTREKDRRRSYDNKYQPHIDEETESDSDSTVYYSSRRREEPKRRHEDFRRRERENTPRKSTRHHDSEDEKVRHASSHISKVEGKSPLEFENRPRLSKYSGSNRSPPPRQSSPPSDTAATRPSVQPRRMSRTTSSATKDRRSSETAEQLGRAHEGRRPSLPTSASDPRHIKVPPPLRHAIPRAATMDARSDRADPGIGIKRSVTSPTNGSGLANMVSPQHNTAPLRSSRLRNETNDSGYSSSSTPETPTIQTPLYKKTQYKYTEEDDEARTPHVISVEPENYFARQREESPRTYRHEPDRPHPSTRTSSNARATPTRPPSYVPETVSSRHPPPPPLSRTESSRPSPVRPKIFGEVSYSSPINKDNIIYDNHRPSTKSQSHHERDPNPDSYPYRDSRRPEMGRDRSYATTSRVH